MNIELLKFPIGHFEFHESEFDKVKLEWIQTIKDFPDEIQLVTEALTNEQLDWKYRPKGWCIKQVVHHCADSHMNSFIRFKLALTEVTPIIRPYEEHLWAEMVDELDYNLVASLLILKGVHHRWVQVLENMTNDDWDKKYIHPASQKTHTLKEALGLYDWHCRHHLAHIKQAIESKGNY